MNASYLRARKTAERLIRRQGCKVNLKKESGGVDKVTGKRVLGYSIPDYIDPGAIEGSGLRLQEAFALILPAGGSESQLDQFKDENGTLDLSKIRKVLISPEGLSWNPDSSTLLEFDGVWWKLYSSGSINPDGDTDIVYKGYIRRV